MNVLVRGKKSILAAALGAVVLLLAGCGSPEQRAERYLRAGRIQFDKGDYTRALLQFFNAMELTPKAPEPYYQVALAYLAAGDARNGIVYLQKAIRKDPTHVASQVKLCELMLMSLDEGQVAEARRRLSEVILKHPENVDALTAMALVEWQSKNPEAAERYLRDAVNRFPSEMKPLIALTRVKLGQGDTAGAEAVLKEAASKPAASAGAVVAYAEFLLLMQRTQEAEQQLKRATAIDPKNTPALLDLAALHHRAGRTADAEKLYRQVSGTRNEYRSVHPDYLFMTGRREEALQLYERLHKENADNVSFRTKLVSAYMALDRILDAQNVISAAVQKNRKDSEALLQRASLRLIAGDAAGAASDATEVLRFQPESAQAHYVLAQVHARQGSTLLGKQELGEALKLNPLLLAARVELADLMVRTNAAKGALLLMDDTPKDQRYSMPAVLQRNRVLMALGNDETAYKEIAAALGSMRLPALLKQQALLRLRARDYEGSRASVLEVLSRNPQDVESVEILARSYIAEGQLKTALAKVGEIASAHPAAAPLQHVYAQLLVVAGSMPEAKSAFEKAHSANPRFAPASMALAQLESKSGGIVRARQLLGEVVQAEPRNTNARLLLAQVERAARNDRAAIEQSKKILEIEPLNVTALNNLSYWLAESNQVDEALRYAEKAKEIAPDHPAVADTIGWVMYRRGLYSAAVRHMEDAVAKEPTPRRRFHLAMAYQKAGDTRRSREALQAGLRLEPDSPEAKAAQEAIVGR